VTTAREIRGSAEAYPWKEEWLLQSTTDRRSVVKFLEHYLAYYSRGGTRPLISVVPLAMCTSMASALGMSLARLQGLDDRRLLHQLIAYMSKLDVATFEARTQSHPMRTPSGRASVTALHELAQFYELELRWYHWDDSKYPSTKQLLRNFRSLLRPAKLQDYAKSLDIDTWEALNRSLVDYFEEIDRGITKGKLIDAVTSGSTISRDTSEQPTSHGFKGKKKRPAPPTREGSPGKLKQSRTKFSERPSLTCTYCGKPRHSAEECRKRIADEKSKAGTTSGPVQTTGGGGSKKPRPPTKRIKHEGRSQPASAKSIIIHPEEDEDYEEAVVGHMHRVSLTPAPADSVATSSFIR